MYSAYCLQNQEYFHTGRDKLTFRESAEDILNWLYEAEEEVPDFRSMTEDQMEDLLSVWEVEIHKHEKPIGD